MKQKKVIYIIEDLFAKPTIKGEHNGKFVHDKHNKTVTQMHAEQDIDEECSVDTIPDEYNK